MSYRLGSAKTSNEEDIVCTISNDGLYDNHAIAYCLLGYMCAYYRHYYPYQFIAAFLENAANDEDLRNATEYAQQNHISIVPPKFGHSSATYRYDAATNTISKGISSIKYMNAAVADALYAVAGAKHFSNFSDVLMSIKQTGIDARQTRNLIRLDYFSEFGNSRELLEILRFMEKLEFGTKKSFKKSNLTDDDVEIIKQFSTDIGKNGNVLQSYTITNISGLIEAAEKAVRDKHIPDFTLREKMADQKDLLGYVDLYTGDEKDRRVLLITDLSPVKSKQTHKTWCYRIGTRSVGSGKSSRLTVRVSDYDVQPFNVGDIIEAGEVRKNQAGYWYLYDYKIVS